MPGIGIVLNPHARGNRRRTGRAERLADIVGDCGVVRETSDIAQLTDVAYEFLARQVEILAVCGGDGSLFHVLSQFIPVYEHEPLPRCLPLRAGTINFVAASIECRRGSPEKVLAHVVRDYRHGGTHDVTERDLLCVNKVQYGFAVGCGAVVNFLRAYYGQQGAGPRSAAGLLARVVLSAIAGTSLARGIVQPVEADIMCDDERVPFRVFTVVLAATVDQIALGFRPTYLGNRKRGYFHLVGGPIGAWTFLRRFGRLRRGLPTGEGSLYDNLARDVTIRFARPAPYMVDGDILPSTHEVHVTTGPRLTMIRG
jgi:diacylglycerol kinase family enzyme